MKKQIVKVESKKEGIQEVKWFELQVGCCVALVGDKVRVLTGKTDEDFNIISIQVVAHSNFSKETKNMEYKLSDVADVMSKKSPYQVKEEDVCMFGTNLNYLAYASFKNGNIVVCIVYSNGDNCVYYMPVL